MQDSFNFLQNKYTKWYFNIINSAKIRSIDRKEKIRQGVLNMPLHTCEHCGKTTTKGNYKRWHNNNCKVIKGELKFLD